MPTVDTTTLSLPFMVNTQDLGPSLTNLSETHLEIAGGYAVSDPSNISGGSGYGGSGLTVSSPNITILDQIKFFVSQNPLVVAVGGIGLLLLLKGGGGGSGGRGRRR